MIQYPFVGTTTTIYQKLKAYFADKAKNEAPEAEILTKFFRLINKMESETGLSKETKELLEAIRKDIRKQLRTKSGAASKVNKIFSIAHNNATYKDTVADNDADDILEATMEFLMTALSQEFQGLKRSENIVKGRSQIDEVVVEYDIIFYFK